MLKTLNGIVNWLNIMDIENYMIKQDKNENFIVDVNGNVNLEYGELKSFPIQFGIIEGYFDCSHNKIYDLKGSPREVKGAFDCSHNLLKSLKNGPIKADSLLCSFNEIYTLEHCPKIIIGDLDCSYNNLEDLKYCPEIIEGAFNYSSNDKINTEEASIIALKIKLNSTLTTNSAEKKRNKI